MFALAIIWQELDSLSSAWVQSVKVQVTSELVELCRQILAENKTVEEWRQFESDDMFQTKNYIGGFDATEMAFCFSYFDMSHQEFWFQCTLLEVNEIVGGRVSELEALPAKL